MRTILLLALAVLCFAPAQAQTAADTTAIIQAALDYAEGWYEGNGERMTQALHPDLAKRIVHTEDGQSEVQHMGAERLIKATQAGFGTQTPAAEQQKDVVILDIFENAASVKLVMRDWIDYLHVGHYNGEWKIINVLWAMKPTTTAQSH